MHPSKRLTIVAIIVGFGYLATAVGDDGPPMRRVGGWHLPKLPVNEVAMFTHPNPGGGDWFGYDVDLVGDTLVVGAISDDHSGVGFAGSVHVFSRIEGAWVHTQMITAAEPQSAGFGRYVALYGNQLFIGAHAEDHSGVEWAGALYVFDWDGESWVQGQRLIASDPTEDAFFGFDPVMVGDTLAVGAPVAGARQGRVYLFEREGEGELWTEKQIVAPSNPASDGRFGWSLDMSEDTLVVGGRWHSVEGAFRAGSVSVFERSDDTWEETHSLNASDYAEWDAFGSGLALSGNVLLIGAVGDDHPGQADAGSVYVFARFGGVWLEQRKLIARDAAEGDGLGDPINLASGLALIGAAGADHGEIFDTGAAYLITTPRAPWAELQKITASDAAEGDWFGSAFAIDKGKLAIGATHDDPSDIADAGSAYLFTYRTRTVRKEP